jgi:hypothetical protein
LSVSFLRDERIVHWERIASRWRLAFSFRLATGILGTGTAFSGSRFHPDLVLQNYMTRVDV